MAGGAGRAARGMPERTVRACRRRLERIGVDAVAGLDRHGTFAEHGYASPTRALQDLLRLDRGVAAQRGAVAEAVCPRVGLDGAALPARLPATADVFAAGDTSLAHVAVVARLLASPPAGRLSPEIWAGAEIQLAGAAATYTPRELQQWGTALLDALDADGPEPDDGPPPQVNELRLTRFATKPGGRLVGRYDDAALFEAIATALDAQAAPLTADDDRTAAERQAEALAEVCGWVLEHGELPSVGGRRPTLTVQIRLEDLQHRARAGMLEFAGQLSPTALRQLACDCGADGARRAGSAAGRRPAHPLDPRRAAPRSDLPRRRLRASRLRPPTILVRNPPPHPVGARRTHRAGQPGHAVQGPPPPDPLHGLGGAPARRDPGVPPARLDRPRPDTPQATTDVGRHPCP